MNISKKEIIGIIKEEIKSILSEQPPIKTGPTARVPAKTFQKAPAPVAKAPAPVAPRQVAPKQAAPAPAKAPAAAPEQEPQPSQYEKDVAEVHMNATELQIYKTKLRIGKLNIRNLTVSFFKSLKDFNAKVTKNTEDKETINSYLAPMKSNLIALKGALEALESEANKLSDIVEEKQ